MRDLKNQWRETNENAIDAIEALLSSVEPEEQGFVHFARWLTGTEVPFSHFMPKGCETSRDCATNFRACLDTVKSAMQINHCLSFISFQDGSTQLLFLNKTASDYIDHLIIRRSSKVLSYEVHTDPERFIRETEDFGKTVKRGAVYQPQSVA